jgi:hypothetical protein
MRPAIKRLPHALLIVAGLFATSLVGTFLFYGSSRYLRNRAEQRGDLVSAGWTRFVAPTGEFTAMFPESPTESVESAPNASSPQSVRAVTAAPSKGEGYTVMTSDVPANPQETAGARLDRLAADFVARSHGTLVSQTQVSVGPATGRELRVDTPERSLRVRLFAMHDKVYQVLAILPVGWPEDGRAGQFLRSFSFQGS